MAWASISKSESPVNRFSACPDGDRRRARNDIEMRPRNGSADPFPARSRGRSQRPFRLVEIPGRVGPLQVLGPCADPAFWRSLQLTRRSIHDIVFSGMSWLRVRFLAAALLSLALLLLGGVPDSLASVLCVHADGATALESGTDRCCWEGVATRGTPHHSEVLEPNAGGCPGCTDFVLTSGARPASRSRQGELPALVPGYLDAAPAAQLARVVGALSLSASKPESPPLALPLRI